VEKARAPGHFGGHLAFIMATRGDAAMRQGAYF
jgi:hypothetical protein